MPRQKSLITVIREIVRKEISQAIQGLLGGASAATRRRRGPGRPPGSKTKRRRGPGRPPKTK